MRHLALKAVTLKVTIFWDVTPCSLVVRFQSFALTAETTGFCQAYVTGIRLYAVTSHTLFLQNAGDFVSVN